MAIFFGVAEGDTIGQVRNKRVMSCGCYSEDRCDGTSWHIAVPHIVCQPHNDILADIERKLSTLFFGGEDEDRARYHRLIEAKSDFYKLVFQRQQTPAPEERDHGIPGTTTRPPPQTNPIPASSFRFRARPRTHSPHGPGGEIGSLPARLRALKYLQNILTDIELYELESRHCHDISELSIMSNPSTPHERDQVELAGDISNLRDAVNALDGLTDMIPLLRRAIRCSERVEASLKRWGTPDILKKRKM